MAVFTDLNEKLELHTAMSNAHHAIMGVVNPIVNAYEHRWCELVFYNGSHGFHCALEFIVNFPGHFEENLDTGTKLLFLGQSRETWDGWQVCWCITVQYIY